MKKVGVLTHYFNSKNYGGNLQAYALIKVISNMNKSITAEQISCVIKKNSLTVRLKSLLLKKSFIEIFRVIKRSVIANSKKMYNTINDKKMDRNCIKLRNDSFDYFNKEMINHSSKIYTSDTFYKANHDYDMFIVGSDQVWNIYTENDVYLLNQISEERIKISYAASISKLSLTQCEKEIFKSSLSSFNAISVREKNAVDLLKNISPVSVSYHLDPTLLLSRSDWDEVCAKRVVLDEYIFCYFLGASVSQRNIVRSYAKSKNLKIVTLPFLLNHYRKCDDGFGDIQLYDISPEKFISLIKYSKFIFTDSFHAAVFSGIYEKQYIIFQRKGHIGMKTRIDTLMDLYGTKERFCDNDSKVNLKHIESLEDIQYNKELKKLVEKRKESLDYLKTNIELFW